MHFAFIEPSSSIIHSSLASYSCSRRPPCSVVLSAHCVVATLPNLSKFKRKRASLGGNYTLSEGSLEMSGQGSVASKTGRRLRRLPGGSEFRHWTSLSFFSPLGHGRIEGVHNRRRTLSFFFEAPTDFTNGLAKPIFIFN
jgi:hypothetical protein